jgi:hypothetical protein
MRDVVTGIYRSLNDCGQALGVLLGKGPGFLEQEPCGKLGGVLLRKELSGS